MKYLMTISFILLCMGSMSYADDIIHATSEDISEFDQLLANEPIFDGKKPGAKGDRPPKKGEAVRGTRGKRGQFKDSERGKEMGKGRRMKGAPRDMREHGRRKPPPPPGQGPPPP